MLGDIEPVKCCGGVGPVRWVVGRYDQSRIGEGRTSQVGCEEVDQSSRLWGDRTSQMLLWRYD